VGLSTEAELEAGELGKDRGPGGLKADDFLVQASTGLITCEKRKLEHLNIT
jgi:hypothetical protein